MKSKSLLFCLLSLISVMTYALENPCKSKNLDDYSSSVCEDACLPALKKISQTKCKTQRENFSKCLSSSAKCLKYGKALNDCEEDIIRTCYFLHH